MTRLVLNRPHTHAGKPCRAGERIVVDAPTANWLIAQGIATQIAPAVSTPHPNPLQRKEAKP